MLSKSFPHAMTSWLHWLRAFAIIAPLGTALVAAVAGCGDSPRPSTVAGSDVTPVSGASWLSHLGLTIENSALGRAGGSAAAPPTARLEPMPAIPAASGSASGVMQRMRRFYRPPSMAGTPGEPFKLAGADLYRLNCQACHGADGRGAPPEINSLLGPVQGTSARLLGQRLEARGRRVDDAFVQQLVTGARQDLLQRLADGGKEMPPFKRLHQDEREALVEYLDRLADVPDAPPAPGLVSDAAVRVGEHLVKITCHICHDATGGPRGRMAVMMNGVAPSLETLAQDYTVDEVIAKVREGSSGMGMMMRASKMPRFPYLTPEEITAADAYLAAYPPRP